MRACDRDVLDGGTDGHVTARVIVIQKRGGPRFIEKATKLAGFVDESPRLTVAPRWSEDRVRDQVFDERARGRVRRARAEIFGRMRSVRAFRAGGRLRRREIG